MIENIKLIGENTTIEMDRTKTDDFVLDIVDIGSDDTNYKLVNSIDVVGVEMDIWYHTISTITITGFVLNGGKGENSLARRKMLLNRFVVPNRKIKFVSKNEITQKLTELEFIVSQSVRYGTTEQTNNEEFCGFMITGKHRPDHTKQTSPEDYPPQTPENFIVNSILDTSAVFTWDATEYTDGYIIEYQQSGKATWNHGIETTENENVTISGLLNDTEYVFRLFAFNQSGNSNATYTELKTLENLTASIILELDSFAYNVASLSWREKNPNELISYSLERKIDNGEFVEIYNGTENTFIDNTLIPRHQYHYRVFADMSTGRTEEGNTVTVSTHIQTPVLTLVKHTLTSYLVQWTARFGATYYVLEISEDNRQTWSEIYNGSGTSFLLDTLEQDKEYIVRVRACDDTTCTGYASDVIDTVLVWDYPLLTDTPDDGVMPIDFGQGNVVVGPLDRYNSNYLDVQIRKKGTQKWWTRRNADAIPTEWLPLKLSPDIWGVTISYSDSSDTTFANFTGFQYTTFTLIPPLPEYIFGLVLYGPGFLELEEFTEYEIRVRRRDGQNDSFPWSPFSNIVTTMTPQTAVPTRKLGIYIYVGTSYIQIRSEGSNRRLTAVEFRVKKDNSEWCYITIPPSNNDTPIIYLKSPPSGSYTAQVRIVNRKGVGPWSDEITTVY